MANFSLTRFFLFIFYFLFFIFYVCVCVCVFVVALPQARKASLARFLEKRRER